MAEQLMGSTKEGDQGVKDGGFNDTVETEAPLTEEQRYFGKLIGNIIWEEARSSGFVEVFQQVQGIPTTEQISQLETASAEATRSSREKISSALNVPIPAKSGGNQIHTALLGAMIRALGCPDREFEKTASDGVPIGLSKDIPFCPLYPRYEPREYDLYPILKEHRNYGSMDLPEVFDP
ncbi:hypothetical protein Pmar_PMAR017213, partial [Perkinsus marinus ATCC 50983]